VKALNRTANASWIVVALAMLGSFGCASNVSYLPAERVPAHLTTRGSDSVDVFLDSKPERPFVEAGVFETNTMSNSASIELIRQRAAEAGLDGIYWIDCTSACSGRCSAKGFKYADASANIASR